MILALSIRHAAHQGKENMSLKETGTVGFTPMCTRVRQQHVKEQNKQKRVLWLRQATEDDQSLGWQRTTCVKRVSTRVTDIHQEVGAEHAMDSIAVS